MDPGILVIVLEMLGDSGSTKQIGKISSILFSAWCTVVSLKAQELSSLQCSDDLGRYKIPSGEMGLYFCTF